MQTLDWDAEGRITQVEEQGEDPVRMVYTADGERLIRDDGDTVTAYLPNAEVTWERDTDEVEGTRYFTHAGQVVAVCTGLDIADWVYLGVDHHGTTTTHAVNAFTAVEQVRRMDPYGNPRGTAPHAWPGQQGFVGGVEDPTGLVHIGARSYDPDTGRFLSVDPILLVGDDQQINGYAYAHNNPVTMTDPTGKCSTTPYGNFGCGVHNSSKAPDRCYGGMFGTGCGSKKSTSGTGSKDSGGGRGSKPKKGTSPNETIDWYETPDGTIVMNGVPLPEGAPDDVDALAAELERLIETHWFLVPEDILNAVALLCDPRQYGEDVDVCSAEFGETAWLLHTSQMLASAGPGVYTAGMGPHTAMVTRAPGRMCRSSFPEDTLVLMADGTYKSIEDINIGDLVLATDPETGITRPQPVTDTSTSTSTKHLTVLTITPPDQPISLTMSATRHVGETTMWPTATLTATSNHPFWAADQSTWTNAVDLQPGNQLHSVNGSHSTITDTTNYTDTLTVHNLSIANTHTYYVLADDIPVLVHNACGPGPVINSGQFGKKWGKHAQDYGLDASNPQHRAQFLQRVHNVHNGPHEVRVGPIGKGGPDHIMYRQGNDLLITRTDGTFVSMYPGANTSSWFARATPWPCACPG